MDWPLVISYLHVAEARVANGKQEIADQQDFVLTLERLRAELAVLNEAAKVGAYE